MKHVWTYWGAVLGQLRPALAVQHRLRRRRRGPNPARAVLQAGARAGTRSVFPGEIPGRSRLALLGRRRGSDRVLRIG